MARLMPARCRRYDGAGRWRAVFGGREPRREGGEIDGLAPDVGQGGTGAGQGAELGGFEEALGSVLEGVENRLEPRGAIINAGEFVEGQGAGVGLVVLDQGAHGKLDRRDDGDKEMTEGRAVAGGGGLDVFSEGTEKGRGGERLRGGLRGGLGLGLGWGLGHGKAPGEMRNAEYKFQISLVVQEHCNPSYDWRYNRFHG